MSDFLPFPVSSDDKRERARLVIIAAADRDIQMTADALERLLAGFSALDRQQLQDFIPADVWDGLMRAMAEYRRAEREKDAP